MMYHFCTITTADHLFKTLALRDSLVARGADICLHVLCIDELPAGINEKNIVFYKTADLAGPSTVNKIIRKYNSSKDKLRWCLKPIFLKYLTAQVADKVIYTDNDIYFYSDYSLLFELLDKYNFLLTPHHYPRDPNKDQNWLEANFKVGLYNAGFIGVNKSAADCLDWWTECCAYRCEKSALRGTYDDQKYLDLIPVINENAYVIRHKGCNVAEWNRATITRTEENGRLMLDGKYPLVFIHFNGTTVRAINEGSEPLLKTSFVTYFNNLKKYKADITIDALSDHPSMIDSIKYSIWKLATKWGF